MNEKCYTFYNIKYNLNKINKPVQNKIMRSKLKFLYIFMYRNLKKLMIKMNIILYINYNDLEYFIGKIYVLIEI